MQRSNTVRFDGHLPMWGSDLWAKTAAENAIHVVEKPFLNKASLVYVSQSTTEIESRNTAKWIDTHVKKKRPIQGPDRDGDTPATTEREKALGQPILPFLSGDAAIGSYLY